MTSRRSKYGSDEERKAAAKAASSKRNDLMKQLLAEYKARQVAAAMTRCAKPGRGSSAE